MVEKMNQTLLTAQNVTLTPTLGSDNASVNITAVQNVTQAQLTMQLAQVQNQIANITNQLATLNAKASSIQGYLALIPQQATPLVNPASANPT